LRDGHFARSHLLEEFGRAFGYAFCIGDVTAVRSKVGGGKVAGLAGIAAGIFGGGNISTTAKLCGRLPLPRLS
jgi:hypothetical protein